MMPDVTCPCCACNGKMCLMYHDGHDHRITEMERKWDIEDALASATVASAPNDEHDDMA